MRANRWEVQAAPTLMPALHSQQKIVLRQLHDPGDLDLEVGNAVTVDIAGDDSDVVGGARLVECLVAKLARLAAKFPGATETEALVATARSIGVDGAQIDVVHARPEVGDRVTVARPHPALGERVEVKHVAASTTGERIAPETAGEMVVTGTAVERVRSAVADKRVGERGADGDLDAYETVESVAGAVSATDAPELHRDAHRGSIIGDGVNPCAAIEDVAAAAPHEDVIAAAADQLVPSTVSLERVSKFGARQVLDADEGIRPFAGLLRAGNCQVHRDARRGIGVGGGIGRAAAVEDIVAPAPHQDVPAATAHQPVRTAVALERVAP